MSALVIKLIACLAMLLDHIGYAWPRLEALRAPGRMAFPLFAFLMAEGYRHTSNRPRYALRLGVFALLSQIPFALFLYRTPWYPNGNVLFSLLLAVLLLWQLDLLRSRHLHILGLMLPAVFFVLCWRGVLRMDYGSTGILLALTFYYFRQRPLPLFLGLAVSVLHPFLLSWTGTVLRLVLGQRSAFAPMEGWELYRFFALFSFVPMLAYNGKPGPRPASRIGSKALQLGFYVFYPAHMLLLSLLRTMI